MVTPQKVMDDLAANGSAGSGAGAAPEIAAAALAARSQGAVGERLCAAREAAGFSVVDVFNGTKVKIALIEAIERGDRARLPAPPFTAGFVKAYAQFLGLDANEYAALYRAEIAAEDAARAAAAAAAATAPAEKTPLRYQAPIFAPVPAGARPAQSFAIAPERLVSYFGMGASLLAVIWIGVMIAAPKRDPGPAPSAIAEAEIGPEAKAKVQGVAATAAPATATPTPTATAPVAAAPEARDAVAAPAADAAADAEVEALESADAVAAGASAAPVRAPRLKPAAARIAASDPAPLTDAGALNAAPSEPVNESAAPTPAPAAAPEPVLVPARLLRPAAPTYPERCAARARTREQVEILIDIGPDGTPQNPRIAATSNACFDPAAIQTALKMRFAPATADGAPRIETAKSVTVEFLK